MKKLLSIMALCAFFSQNAVSILSDDLVDEYWSCVHEEHDKFIAWLNSKNFNNDMLSELVAKTSRYVAHGKYAFENIMYMSSVFTNKNNKIKHSGAYNVNNTNVQYEPAHQNLKPVYQDPDIIDAEYDFLLKKYNLISEFESLRITPEQIVKEFFGADTIPMEKIHKGKYTMALNTWVSKEDVALDCPRGQGWKLHISAHDYSATKIAKLILPHLLDDQHNSLVLFKIATSIPHLRTLNYILGNLPDEETQAGKFLVIYGNTIEDAYKWAKKIDTILLKAKQNGELVDADFLPLRGDVQVGNSGGVYARYGRFAPGELKKLTPKDKTMYGRGTGVFTYDDRFYPWPDCMNKLNLEWKNAPNPFKDLPVRWKTTPIVEDRFSSWSNRPLKWYEE